MLWDRGILLSTVTFTFRVMVNQTLILHLPPNPNPIISPMEGFKAFGDGAKGLLGNVGTFFGIQGKDEGENEDKMRCTPQQALQKVIADCQLASDRPRPFWVMKTRDKEGNKVFVNVTGHISVEFTKTYRKPKLIVYEAIEDTDSKGEFCYIYEVILNIKFAAFFWSLHSMLQVKSHFIFLNHFVNTPGIQILMTTT